MKIALVSLFLFSFMLFGSINTTTAQDSTIQGDATMEMMALTATPLSIAATESAVKLKGCRLYAGIAAEYAAKAAGFYTKDGYLMVPVVHTTDVYPTE